MATKRTPKGPELVTDPPPRPKQTQIAGTERKVAPAVNTAGQNYVAIRDKRMTLTKKEKEAKDALIVEMRKAGETVYRDDTSTPPLIITLSSTDNVKVTKVGFEEENEEA